MRPTLMPLLACLFAIPAGSPAAADDPFLNSVVPVLARRCLSCHNDQKTGGGLSMVEPQRLIDDGYIAGADAGSSHIVELISPSNGRAEMPKDSDPLSAEEITAIRRWIDAGAVLPPDFQLQPPKIADRQWWSLEPIGSDAEGELRTIVDERLDAKLVQHGLTPLPPADPVTLIRRVTYDLSGLPPTPQQVDAFVAQSRIDPAKAWQDLVDRLLAAPEFGEKWGQHWLDIARYAETHGYDKDQPRNNAWPYRDYVINSFNSD